MKDELEDAEIELKEIALIMVLLGNDKMLSKKDVSLLCDRVSERLFKLARDIETLKNKQDN